MINATIIRNSLEQVVGCIIKGHSRDIVCASASMLMTNTANCIEKLTNLAESDYECVYNKDGGYFRLILGDVAESNHDARLLMSALHLGLASIGQYYPNDFKLKEKKAK